MPSTQANFQSSTQFTLQGRQIRHIWMKLDAIHSQWGAVPLLRRVMEGTSKTSSKSTYLSERELGDQCLPCLLSSCFMLFISMSKSCRFNPVLLKQSECFALFTFKNRPSIPFFFSRISRRFTKGGKLFLTQKDWKQNILLNLTLRRPNF